MPTVSSGAVRASPCLLWSRGRSLAPTGLGRGSSVSGDDSRPFAQARERPMARADRARSATAIRCAIYTRKSSDDGLEQEFNSLNAERKACEAYIVSQRHAGWSRSRICTTTEACLAVARDRILGHMRARRNPVMPCRRRQMAPGGDHNVFATVGVSFPDDSLAREFGHGLLVRRLVGDED